jgi:hypothetical protein
LGELAAAMENKIYSNGKEKSVYFYLKYGLISLNGFVKMVKNQNTSGD